MLIFINKNTMVLGYDQDIKPQPDDAPEFIGMINKIMGALIYQYHIDEICYIKIKNWFDHKWLNYSGKAVVPFEKVFIDDRHAALEETWRDPVTVPPFNPNRVLKEQYFRKKDTENKKFEKLLHKCIASNDNLHNRIIDYSDNGLFIWYSSDSERLGRASLMVYRVQQGEVETWYANFQFKHQWELVQSKGIGVNELRAYL